MKKLLFFSLILINFSCSENTLSNPITTDQIIGKWNFYNGPLISIEFNKSMSYLLVSNKDGLEEIEFGDYSVLDKSISLNGFEKLLDINVAENQIDLKFDDGTNEIEIGGIKENRKLNTNDSIAYLFKTWVLYSCNEVPVSGTVKELQLFISEAGTYYVNYLSDEIEDFVAYVSWSNFDERILCYSFQEETENCQFSNGFINIINLSNSELIIQELSVDPLLKFTPL